MYSQKMLVEFFFYLFYEQFIKPKDSGSELDCTAK